MTNKEFRQEIITRVTSEIEALGYREYMKVPVTTPRKVSFDAHVRLTQPGRIHFGEDAVFSKQIIHPELNELQIGNEPVPVNFLNQKERFINHAVVQLQEFIGNL